MPAVRKKKKEPTSTQTKRQRTSDHRGRGNNAGLGMVLTDGDPIRKRIKKDYEQTQRRLEKARGDLDRFHREDVPKFAQWLNTHFGSLLTTLRESSQRVAEAEQLVFEIENEVFFTGISYGAAYRQVIKRRNHPPAQDPHSTSDKDQQTEGDAFDPFSAFEDFIDGEEAAHDNSDPGESAHGRRGNPRSRSRKEKVPSNRLKELYRALVRMLHPDSAKDLTDQQREVWHQVQTAYEAGDVEQLEVILALQQAAGKEPAETTSLSLLQKITHRFKTALKEIQAQLRKLRKDPAWKFTDRKDLTALRHTFRENLEDDIFRVQLALEHFESLLEKWKKEAKRSKRGSPQDNLDLW